MDLAGSRCADWTIVPGWRECHRQAVRSWSCGPCDGEGMGYKKKLIEVALPLDAISRASAREKWIRHGHPSTLHLWWAWRPLASARAVLWASLVDDRRRILIGSRRRRLRRRSVGGCWDP